MGPLTMAFKVSDGMVEVTRCLGHVTGWTGAEDVQQFRKSQTGVWSPVVNLPAQSRCSDSSTLQHLLTEGGRANRTAEKAETTASNRNVCREGLSGSITMLRNKEERLAMLEIQAQRRTLALHNLEGS